MLERLKQFFERLARINQEEFKGAAPDCCKINRSKPQPKAEGNGPKKPECRFRFSIRRSYPANPCFA